MSADGNWINTDAGKIGNGILLSPLMLIVGFWFNSDGVTISFENRVLEDWFASWLVKLFGWIEFDSSVF